MSDELPVIRPDATIEDMFDLAGAAVVSVIARLVPCGSAAPVEISEETHKIGRGKDIRAGYKFEHARLSSVHCEILTNMASNVVRIVDRSTNGTFVNGTRIKKGEPLVLNPGDSISLLNKAVDGDMSLEFVFQQVKKVTTEETLLEELTCDICKAILYQPCTALPCLHSFCGGCISKWIATNTSCPDCRSEIYEIRPSFKLDSLVTELIKRHPDRARTAEEKAELEKANTIPSTGMILKTKRAREEEFSDYSEDDSGSYGSSEEEEEDEDWLTATGHGPPGTVFHHMPGFGPKTPSACPQCHTPGPDGFQCPAGGSHLACFSCKAAFPDRPLSTIPQRCFLCSTPFCDLYLGGCRSPAGRGYLQPVKDHVLDILPVGTLFSRNMIEVEILQRHMAVIGETPAGLWRQCLQQFKDNNWIPDVVSIRGTLTPDSPVCKPCCLRVFAALLYHYRRSIPTSALPPAVGSRPDCWYGVQCRTQHKNAAHAQKFNHVCRPEKRKE